MTSSNTQLNDRVLWYDGDSSIPEGDLTKILFSGINLNNIYVNNVTQEIKQYNKLVTPEKQIFVKHKLKQLYTNWTIPEEYTKLDVFKYVIDKFNDIERSDEKATRLTTELLLYKKLDLLDFLKALIYIINTFQNNNIVWGVGRGSSVSSYVLFIIGVHDVDSHEYDLNITDFLK